MLRKLDRRVVAGPAGPLECIVEEPAGDVRGVAVVCHPHPVHGGTMDNKVAQTLARAAIQVGFRAVRFNFRGVGGSAGAWDEGRGEVDDALAVIQAFRVPALPLALAGFSFGGYVASRAALALSQTGPVDRIALIGPATETFDVAPVPAGSLVVHGEADDVVPLKATLDWARPQSQPVVVIPGVGHFFHGQLPLLKSLVVGAWQR
jgi:alpha/beta superfamily hydrolase